MRRTGRPNQITLRLDDEEVSLREQLGRRYGIDGAGVMRQALHRWAREEGLHESPRKVHPPAKAAKSAPRPR